MHCHGILAVPLIEQTLHMIRLGMLSACPTHKIRRLLKKSMNKANHKRNRRTMDQVRQAMEDIVTDIKFSDIVTDLDN